MEETVEPPEVSGLTGRRNRMNELACKLRNMKSELGLSNKELSDLSSVPIGDGKPCAGRKSVFCFKRV